MIKKVGKKIVQTVKKDNERGARRQLVEELFYDFHRNRPQVYWLNFTRGVFFGFGTVLGGTVVVAFIIWVLVQIIGWFPPISIYIQQIIDAMKQVR
jgi:hypothetical protein